MFQRGVVFQVAITVFFDICHGANNKSSNNINRVYNSTYPTQRYYYVIYLTRRCWHDFSARRTGVPSRVRRACWTPHSSATMNYSWPKHGTAEQFHYRLYYCRSDLGLTSATKKIWIKKKSLINYLRLMTPIFLQRLLYPQYPGNFENINNFSKYSIIFLLYHFS